MNNEVRDAKSVNDKALALNLNPLVYGSIAEIGAGQEVAANFFRVGGAAGTVAKTISAYDMTFSDKIYGKEDSGRYVCESRLHKMLKKEYKLVIERLTDIRPPESTFFSFADTVAARNYHGNNECHGWLGVRFQLTPKSEPNEVVIHVRMLDSQNFLQCQAVGIIGTNLIYACYHYINKPEQFLLSLMDSLHKSRIEIDMIRVKGPDVKHFDNRLLSLWLVKHGLTGSAMFNEAGEVVQPGELLYKKSIFVLRGSFRPPTFVNIDMLKNGVKQFLKEEHVDKKQMITLAELTLNNLAVDGELSEEDFLSRVDLLLALGVKVMISNYHEYYRLSQYLARFTKQPIAMGLGIDNFQYLFQEHFYQNLPGGALEAMGKLFSQNVKLYVYPMLKRENDKLTELLITADNCEIPDCLNFLYQYLRCNGKVVDYQSFQESKLHIFSREVLSMLKTNQPGWETMVPEVVQKTIKKQKLFGYRPDI